MRTHPNWILSEAQLPSAIEFVVVMAGYAFANPPYELRWRIDPCGAPSRFNNILHFDIGQIVAPTYASRLTSGACVRRIMGLLSLISVVVPSANATVTGAP